MSESVHEVVFHQDESGAWIADVPSLPGCHSYGSTIDEARTNIREAVELWLQVDDVVLTETNERVRPG